MGAEMGGSDVKSLRIRKFEVGDLVFAKLKGYPPWPSKINQIESIVSGGKETIRYNVFFYGTHQSSILRSTSLYHYDTYAKPIVDKWGRRPKFHEALEELERELMAKISYLQELRSTPDSSWGPSFTNACNGLLSDMKHSSVNNPRNLKTKDESNKIKKRVSYEKENTWNDESRARGYEILYIETIPFPTTSESLIIVSLGFNEEWVRNEAKKIEEEEKMMNCHVNIEPFPLEYKHLIRGQSALTPENSGDDGCSTPERALRYPRRVEHSTFHLSRKRSIRAAIKVQEQAAKRRTVHTMTRKKRKGGKIQIRRSSEDSDSDSVMETCSVCRLCFFSQNELMEHESSVHDVKNTVKLSINGDTESETDTIFNDKPTAVKNHHSNKTSSKIVVSEKPGVRAVSKQTLYLQEGFPVDSYTTRS